MVCLVTQRTGGDKAEVQPSLLANGDTEAYRRRQNLLRPSVPWLHPFHTLPAFLPVSHSRLLKRGRGSCEQTVQRAELLGVEIRPVMAGTKGSRMQEGDTDVVLSPRTSEPKGTLASVEEAH